MKLKNKEFNYYKVSADFTIELDDKQVVVVNKYSIEDDIAGYDQGSEIVKGEEIVAKMDDEQKDELDDFIHDLNFN